MVETATLDAPDTLLLEEDVRHLLALMGFSEVAVRAVRGPDEYMRVTVEAGEAGRSLIGTHGSHLAALQHILRCLIQRRLGQPVRIIVDVNNYRARREQSLLNLAEQAARKAEHTGHTTVLEPMSAADRRAIHSALSQNKHVRTESVGEEPSRRVVIKPAFL